MADRRLLTTAALIALLAGTPAAAQARTPVPHLTSLRCVPATASGCASGVALLPGKLVQVRGSGLKAGYRATFRWSSGAIASQLKKSRAGLVARVPAGVKPGTIELTVRDKAKRRSNALKLKVLRSGPTPVKPAPTTGLPAAFAGSGMWIWQLERSDAGNPVAIAARAKAAGMQTVFVKSADGTTPWAQFSPALIQSLHAQGIRVCAWQFVYGKDPADEARAAATTIARGADCFVIDAESSYEGRYSAAQKYVTALRSAVGASYPLGLTSFPYVDYHPWLPFSVFLGTGAAEVNMPQVYWKDIGGSVDAVSSHTFVHNRVYQRAVAPLGQTYQSAGATDLRRFRAVWSAFGASGLSWWSWQETSNAQWSVLDEAAPAPAALADPGWPSLGKGSKGDEVVVVQQRLKTLDPSVGVDGQFGAQDAAALQAFQTSKAIPPTGRTDPTTWQALLAVAPTAVDWTARSSPSGSTRGARAARVHAAEIPELGRGG